jgi:hypothetical protein
LAVGTFWEEVAGDLFRQTLWLAVEEAVGVDWEGGNHLCHTLRLLVGVGSHAERDPPCPACEGQAGHRGSGFGLCGDEVVLARQLLVQLCQSRE